MSDTPFHDLDDYIALPRLGGLAISPDGQRLVTTVSALNEDRTTYQPALWEVDPAGERPARRLTHGPSGESQPTFTAGGDLLFVAKRGTDDDARPAVWSLPAAGGEASMVAAHPGGVSGVSAAARAAVVVVMADALPSAGDVDEDHRLRKERSERKVSAILHSAYPVRYWDHDLGPDLPRLYSAEPTDADPAKDAAPRGSHALRELTPAAGAALTEASTDLAVDGSFLVTTWNVPVARGAVRTQLCRVDLPDGARTVLVDDTEAEVGGPRVSPDGRLVAYVRETLSTAEQAPRMWVEVVDAVGGESRALTREWDRWPAQLRWLPDSSGLLVVADDDGRSRLFHVALDTGAVTRLTDEGALSDVVVAPDGTAAYALRASYEYPAEVVRIDLGDLTGEAEVTALRGPAERPALPGTLTEVETTAADGTRVRAWLALPEGASADAPAPLLLWIHGGPLGSWNSWSWRWNPWIMVARGYAVLLPDPALSTGYGQDFVQRGWGAWGEAPYTDLMAVTDAVEERADVDASRTAAMGGSFGGYMANWVAGHTDRFRAVVTHASLWALDAFGPTTDAAWYWGREMSPEMALANSPHLHVGSIRTPMLVIHGDKDYRVPIGEGLRLWYELLSRSGLPADEDGASPHRFLYFPDENHWILTPQNAKVWYEVNLAFLAEHVLGAEPGHLPRTLG
ncbi:prolyl oligopeptidase family serine peptidase [Georgenia satyanarayanai]|uniref:S9 family peptidase n=1 Tax=Georgenia satyanarayanai TaxID=860221 RepID=UPI00203A9C30|nr:prolyl oligopeptidase family serine peptidase [Georgenia satyanarayanai]MCM3660455.1 prolyl oligopeptidase family serine peptidase [Georgenia satyanarayanai]